MHGCEEVMHRPIVVYLDSQDFSRLSDAKMDASISPVRDKLLELKREGIARFAFSDVLVYECLPVKPEDAALSLKRIESIVEFCDGQSLPPASEVIRSELGLLISQEGKYSKFANQPFSGHWFPKLDLTSETRDVERNAAKTAFSNLKETMGLSLSRNERRAFLKKFKSSNKADGYSSLASQGMSDLASLYPIDLSDKHLLAEYLRCGNSRVLLPLVEKSLGDLLFFSRWCVDNWDGGQKFVRSLRSGNDQTKASLIRFYEHMKEVNGRALEVISERELSSMLADKIEEMRDWFVSSFAAIQIKNFLGVDVPNDGRFRPSLVKTPAVLSWLEFTAAVLVRSAAVAHPRNPHKKSHSDFADSMHVLYLPRVDIFRADRFTSQILEGSLSFQSTVVEPSLEKLPETIHRAWDRRGAC